VGGVGYLIWAQFAGLLENRQVYTKRVAAKFDELSGGEAGMFGAVRKWVEEFNTERKTIQDEKLKQAEKNAKQATAGGEPADRGGDEQPPNTAEGIQKAPRGSIPEKPLYTQPATSGWPGWTEILGPAAEGLATTFLVIVSLVFMLIQRENLRNRVVRLVGRGRLVTTTEAFNEGAERISRFLVMQLTVNAGFGFLLALVLFVLSLFAGDETSRHTLRSFAILWGFIAGTLRFIPYLGTWLAAALLFGFCVATLEGWTIPLLVFGAFIVLELLTANVIEPLLFGHSTGVTPLALLLAAAFWTWLWGPVGLLLSTPMTVVLLVVGKFVPQLKWLEVLLGDEEPLRPGVVYYQRLLAGDQDEASDLVDEYAQDHSPEELFQDVMMPALVQAKHDRERGELDEGRAAFVFHVTRDILEDLDAAAAEALAESRADGTATTPPPRKVVVTGVPGHDEADELALLMLRQLLRPQGYDAEVIPYSVLTAEAIGRVSQSCPAVACVGSLAPGGLAQARYLCKRVKAQCRGVKIVVGRWGQKEEVDRVRQRLKGSGADLVGTTLAETRSQVIPLIQFASAADASGRPAPGAGQELVTTR
jgi:hypothetical protein